MRPNQNSKPNNDLITIPVKAVTTLEDANQAILRNSERLYKYVQTELKRYGISQPFCDLRFGLNQMLERNPYDEIINISNGIHNALREGWFFYFESERLRRELAELKGRKIEAVDYKEIK